MRDRRVNQVRQTLAFFAGILVTISTFAQGQESLSFFEKRSRGLVEPATVIRFDDAPEPDRQRWAPFLQFTRGAEIYLDRDTLNPRTVRPNFLPLVPGSASSIPGPFPDSLDSIVSAVDAFVSANPEVIRAPTGFRLDLDILGSGRTLGEYWVVQYGLSKNTTPVRNSHCSFIINRGNLSAWGCENLVPGNISTTPTISANAANLILRAYLNDGLGEDDSLESSGPTLWVHRGATTTYRLTWEFSIERAARGESYLARVDALSGEIIEFFSVRAYENFAPTPAASPATIRGEVWLREEPGKPAKAEVAMPFADWSEGNHADQLGVFTPIDGVPVRTRLQGQFVNLVSEGCVFPDTGSTRSFVVAGSADGGIDLGPLAASGCAHNCGILFPGVTKTCDNIQTEVCCRNANASRTAYYWVNEARRYAMSILTPSADDDWQVFFDTPIRLLTDVTVESDPSGSSPCSNAYFQRPTIIYYEQTEICRGFGELPQISLHEYGHGLDQTDEHPYTLNEASKEAVADIFEMLYFKSADSCHARGAIINGMCEEQGHLYPCKSCNGTRDWDYNEHLPPVPMTPENVNLFCGPAGADSKEPCRTKSPHCESQIASQSFWDFIQELGKPDYLGVDRWGVAESLWFSIMNTREGGAYSCEIVTSDSGEVGRGCLLTHWFSALRTADGGMGNSGSMYASALFRAFNRHGIACGTETDPANIDSCMPLAPFGGVATTLNGTHLQLSWPTVENAHGYYVLRSRRGCPTLPPEGSDCGQDAGGVETCKFLVLGNGTTTWSAILPDAGMYGFAVVPIGHSKRCLGTPSSCSVVYVCFDGQPGTELSEDEGVSVTPAISTAPLSAATASLTQIEAVADGSFEAGRTGISWQTSATRGSPIIHQAEGSAQARSGRFVAELGGSNNVTDLLSQTVILPAGAASPSLRFSYWVRSTGNEGVSGDHLVVSIDALDGSPLVEVARLTAADSGSEWMDHAAISLAGWAGRAFGLRFEAATNNTSPTTFFIDDVSLVYTPTASSLSVAFLNPRTGCGGFGGGRIEVGGSTDISVVSTVSGPGGKTLIRRNGEVIGWSYGSRAIAHLDVTDSNESITLEAEAVEKDGRRAICPIQVIPRQVLLDSGFEDGPGELNWTTTSTGTGFNRSQVIISGQNPRPAFGDYMLRLGARTGTTQKASQRFKVPTDIQSGTVSFYLRVFTMKNTSTELDLLKVILVADDGSAIEELIRFSNASAATVASTEPGAYSLVLLPIPTQFYGKVVDIRFEASITNSNPTTFFLDGIGVTLTSRSLDQDPPLVLNVNLASVQPLACDSVAVVADASADADRLRLIDARTGATLASCEFCSSVSATIALGGANCRPVRLEAETTATLQRSPIFWVVPDAARCPGGGGVSSPTFQFPLNGEVLNGLVHARSANADAACTRESRVFLDGVMVKQTTGGIVDYLLDSSQIADGLHRLDVQSVNASGDVSPLLGSSSTTFRIANSLPCEAFVNETLACSPDASDHVSSGFSLCDLREPRCTGTFTGPQGAIDSELIEFLRFCAARALVRVRAGEINCTGVLVGTTEDFATILTAADCVTDVDATAITVTFEGSADQTPRSATCGSCGNGGTCSSSISTADAWALVQLRPDAVPPDVLPVPLARRDEFPEGEVRAVGMWLDSPAAQPNRPLVATSQDSDGRFYPASVTIAPDGTAVTNTDFDGAAANLCNAGGVLFSYDKRVIGVATKASAGDCLTESCRSVSRPAFSVPTNATCTTCANPNRIARITSYPSYWAADSYKIRAQIGDEPSGVPEVDFQRIQVEVQKNDSPPVVVGCCSKVGDCSDPCANGTIVGNVCELNWMSALVTPETNARFVLRVSGVDSEGCVAKESQVAIRLWRCGSGGATYDAYMDYNCAQP